MAAGIWFTALAVYAIGPVVFLAWSTIEVARWHSTAGASAWAASPVLAAATRPGFNIT